MEDQGGQAEGEKALTTCVQHWGGNEQNWRRDEQDPEVFSYRNFLTLRHVSRVFRDKIDKLFYFQSFVFSQFLRRRVFEQPIIPFTVPFLQQWIFQPLIPFLSPSLPAELREEAKGQDEELPVAERSMSGKKAFLDFMLHHLTSHPAEVCRVIEIIPKDNLREELQTDAEKAIFNFLTQPIQDVSEAHEQRLVEYANALPEEYARFTADIVQSIQGTLGLLRRREGNNLSVFGGGFRNLSGADFRKAGWAQSITWAGDFFTKDVLSANLRAATVRNANFTAVSFLGADLSGINFEGANFTSAILRRTNFTGANFTGANLTKADLGEARLDRVCFSYADPQGFTFLSADFRGASCIGWDLPRDQDNRIPELILALEAAAQENPLRIAALIFGISVERRTSDEIKMLKRIAKTCLENALKNIIFREFCWFFKMVFNKDNIFTYVSGEVESTYPEAVKLIAGVYLNLCQTEWFSDRKIAVSRDRITRIITEELEKIIKNKGNLAINNNNNNNNNGNGLDGGVADAGGPQPHPDKLLRKLKSSQCCLFSFWRNASGERRVEMVSAGLGVTAFAASGILSATSLNVITLGAILGKVIGLSAAIATMTIPCALLILGAALLSFAITVYATEVMDKCCNRLFDF